MATTPLHASSASGAEPYDDATVATAVLAQPPAPPRRSLLARWARDVAFHCAGLFTSILGFTVWVTGVSVSLSLAITMMGLIATLASFYAFRWFARLERHRAALVLGATIPERYRRAPAGSGWWARLRVAAKRFCGLLVRVLTRLELAMCWS